MSRPWRLGIATAQVLFTLAFAVGVYIDLRLLVPGLPSLPLSETPAAAPGAAAAREDRAPMTLAPPLEPAALPPAPVPEPNTTRGVAPVPAAPIISRTLVPSAPVAVPATRAIAVSKPVPVISPSLPSALAPTTPQASAVRPAVVASAQSDAARARARPAAPPFAGKDGSAPPRTQKTKPHV